MKRRSLVRGVLRVDARGELTRVDVGGSAVLTTTHATMIVV